MQFVASKVEVLMFAATAVLTASFGILTDQSLVGVLCFLSFL